jgi:hypothetical protein
MGGYMREFTVRCYPLSGSYQLSSPQVEPVDLLTLGAKDLEPCDAFRGS